MGIFNGELDDEILDPNKHDKRFNCVTDEEERIRKVISGDPNKFLRTNGG